MIYTIENGELLGHVREKLNNLILSTNATPSIIAEINGLLDALQANADAELAARLQGDQELSAIFNNSLNEVNNDLTDLKHRVDAVQGRGGNVGYFDFGVEDPEQSAITEKVKELIWGDNAGSHSSTEIFNGTSIVNAFNGHEWVLSNTQDTDPPVFFWGDAGTTTVSQATEFALGVVKSAANNGDNIGKINVLPDGTQVVIGFDTKMDKTADIVGDRVFKTSRGETLDQAVAFASANPAIRTTFVV